MKQITAEEKFNKIFHLSPVGMTIADDTGRWTEANESFLKMTGYSREEVVGHTSSEIGLMDPRAREALLKRLQRDGSITNCETNYLNKSGEIRTAIFSNVKISIEGSTGFISILHDITERKKSEEALRIKSEELEKKKAEADQYLISLREVNQDLERRVAERTKEFSTVAKNLNDFKDALDLHAIVAITNQQGRITYVNDKFCEISKFSREELIGQDHRVINSGHHSKDFIRHLWSTIANGKVWKGEIKNRAKDGSSYWVDTTIVPFLKPDGKPYQYVAIRADITKRKEVEDALRESGDFNQQVIAGLSEGIAVLDSNFCYRVFNPFLEELTGVKAAQVIGKNMGDVFGPDQLADSLPRLKRALNGETFHSEDLFIPSVIAGARERWISSKFSPQRNSFGKITGVIVCVNEITERKQNESTNAQLAAIVQSSDDAIIGKNLHGVITSWNSGAEKIFGFTPEETIGKSISLLIPPDRNEEESEILDKLRSGKSAHHFETLRVRKDGALVDVSVIVSPVLDTKEKIIGASTIIRDIRDQKTSRKKLLDQLGRLNLLHHITRAIGEKRDLRSIFQVAAQSLEENLPLDFCCVCLHDQPNKTLTVSTIGLKGKALAISMSMGEEAVIPIDENGLSRCVKGELVYEPDIQATPFPFPQRLSRAGLRCLVIAPLVVETEVFGVLVAARIPGAGFSSGECEFISQLSGHVALAAHQAQLRDALQAAYDDLRQTQRVVMQQERLSALGQMASGIAHDINNAISPISLYTESLLEKEPNLSERARRYIETIGRAIEDVSSTVAGLREFYRPRELQRDLVPVSLNRLGQQVIELTSARWSDLSQKKGVSIEVKSDWFPGLPKIRAIESEIRDAVTNLVFNSVDAMPSGGILHIRTFVETEWSARTHHMGGRTVVLEVVDTGVGMDEETQRRCLEPFFTTKGERGTGLGLAMVYGSMKRHNGEIKINSTLGGGTTVQLRFSEELSQIENPIRHETPPASPTHFRILVVDDDPLLLKSVGDTLEEDGHLVVRANGGQEGIRIFVDHLSGSAPFDLVMTDLGMPNVDGRNVAAAVKGKSASTPVVLLTGWGQRLIEEEGIPPHVDRVLGKPPKLKEIRSALFDFCAEPAREKEQRHD